MAGFLASPTALCDRVQLLGSFCGGAPRLWNMLSVSKKDFSRLNGGISCYCA